MWLAERAGQSCTARSGLPAMSRKKKFPESHITNPLLTFIDNGWILALFFFCEFMDLDINTQLELGQYPTMLAKHLASNPYMSVVYVTFRWTFS